MAITILTFPAKYATLNLCSFKVSSDRPTIIQFKVVVIDDATSTIMSTQRYATLPMTPNGTTFDLAPLLSSFVDYEIVNTITVIEPTPNTIRRYRINITELYIDGSGNQVEGDTINVDPLWILNVDFSRIDFALYNYRDYVMGSGAQTSVFLSRRPKVTSIFFSSKQFLYFYSEVAAVVRVKYYKKNTGLVATRDYPVDGVQRSYRIDVSPAALSFSGNEFTGEFTVQFGTSSFAIFDYYTVEVYSTGGALLSETRTYSIRPDKCTERVELLFSNNIGGIDTLTFDNPKQTVTSSKTSIKSNPYQFDAEGNYYDVRRGVFNRENVVIASINTTSFSIVSEPMSDEYATFSKSLFESDNVYVKLSNGFMYPVTVTDTSYPVGSRRYSTSNNRLTVNFSITGGNIKL